MGPGWKLENIIHTRVRLQLLQLLCHSGYSASLSLFPHLSKQEKILVSNLQHSPLKGAGSHCSLLWFLLTLSPVPGLCVSPSPLRMVKREASPLRCCSFLAINQRKEKRGLYQQITQFIKRDGGSNAVKVQDTHMCASTVPPLTNAQHILLILERNDYLRRRHRETAPSVSTLKCSGHPESFSGHMVDYRKGIF